MQIADLQALIESAFPNSEIEVDGDGYNHRITIISDQFQQQNRVQRQQLVYQALGEAIRSGQLHALQMKTYTPEEWAKKS